MKVTRTSIVSGITRTVDIPITSEQAYEYAKGDKPIQQVFPNLSPVQREFILNGITQEEWDELYPPEKEENGNT